MVLKYRVGVEGFKRGGRGGIETMVDNLSKADATIKTLVGGNLKTHKSTIMIYHADKSVPRLTVRNYAAVKNMLLEQCAPLNIQGISKTGKIPTLALWNHGYLEKSQN